MSFVVKNFFYTQLKFVVFVLAVFSALPLFKIKIVIKSFFTIIPAKNDTLKISIYTKVIFILPQLKTHFYIFPQ